MPVKFLASGEIKRFAGGARGGGVDDRLVKVAVPREFIEGIFTEIGFFVGSWEKFKVFPGFDFRGRPSRLAARLEEFYRPTK